MFWSMLYTTMFNEINIFNENNYLAVLANIIDWYRSDHCR